MKKILTIILFFIMLVACNSFFQSNEINNLIENINKKEKEQIVLYVSSWCPYCKSLLDKIKEDEKNIKKELIVVFIPYIPDNGKLKEYFDETDKYIKEKDFKLSVILDNKLQIKEMLSIKKLPTILYINKNVYEEIEFSNDEKIMEFLKNKESGEK